MEATPEEVKDSKSDLIVDDSKTIIVTNNENGLELRKENTEQTIMIISEQIDVIQ